MNGVDVSVIIVTYNSDFEKLKKTIKSVICQKNVDFEVIVCDDGSKIDFSAETDTFFKENHFTNYTIIRNPENLGTIRNIDSGLKTAKGEYVYTISPGDFLYDENTVAEFLHFAREKQAKICFGNYIKYSYENQNLKFYENEYAPDTPEKYTQGIGNSKIAFFLLDTNICGVAYFREKNFFIKSLNCVMNYSVYVEDRTTLAYALIHNVDVQYLDRNISWYEYGTGISTNKEDKWQKITQEDYENFLKQYIYLHYGSQRIVKANKEGYIGYLFFIKYPVLAFKRRKLNSISKKTVIPTNQDKEKLLKLLKG